MWLLVLFLLSLGSATGQTVSECLASVDSGGVTYDRSADPGVTRNWLFLKYSVSPLFAHPSVFSLSAAVRFARLQDDDGSRQQLPCVSRLYGLHLRDQQLYVETWSLSSSFCPGLPHLSFSGFCFSAVGARATIISSSKLTGASADIRIEIRLVKDLVCSWGDDQHSRSCELFFAWNNRGLCNKCNFANVDYRKGFLRRLFSLHVLLQIPRHQRK